MKKATLKKLLEWALTIGLVALLVVVVYHRFFGPGKQPQAQVWNPLPGVATVEVADNRETITRGLMGAIRSRATTGCTSSTRAPSRSATST